MNYSTKDAFLISALSGAVAYGAYKYNLVPKRIAIYGGLGLVALSILAVEFDSISNDLPEIAVFGVGLALLATFV